MIGRLIYGVTRVRDGIVLDKAMVKALYVIGRIIDVTEVKTIWNSSI